MRRNQHPRLRILQHILQPIQRIFIIKGDIGPTCLEYRNGTDQELLAPWQHHRRKAVLFHAFSQQLRSQSIRSHIQRTVSQRAVRVHHSGGLRPQLSLFLKQIHKSLTGIIGKGLPCSQCQQPLLLRFCQQRKSVNFSGWLRFRHFLSKVPHGLSQNLNVFVCIEAAVILKKQPIIISLR